MIMAFVGLAGVPDLGLTERGLIDVATQAFTPCAARSRAWCAAAARPTPTTSHRLFDPGWRAAVTSLVAVARRGRSRCRRSHRRSSRCWSPIDARCVQRRSDRWPPSTTRRGATRHARSPRFATPGPGARACPLELGGIGASHARQPRSAGAPGDARLGRRPGVQGARRAGPRDPRLLPGDAAPAAGDADRRPAAHPRPGRRRGRPQGGRSVVDHGDPRRQRAGSLLNGTKIYTTGAAEADEIAVWAFNPTVPGVADNPLLGFQLSLVRRDADGVTVHRDWDALGQRATDSGTITFADVFVGEDQRANDPGQCAAAAERRALPGRLRRSARRHRHRRAARGHPVRRRLVAAMAVGRRHVRGRRPTRPPVVRRPGRRSGGGLRGDDAHRSAARRVRGGRDHAHRAGGADLRGEGGGDEGRAAGDERDLRADRHARRRAERTASTAGGATRARCRCTIRSPGSRRSSAATCSPAGTRRRGSTLEPTDSLASCRAR